MATVGSPSNPMLTRYAGTWWKSSAGAQSSPTAKAALDRALSAGLNKPVPTTDEQRTQMIKDIQKGANLPQTGAVDDQTARALNFHTTSVQDSGAKVAQLRSDLEKLGYKFNPKADRNKFDNEVLAAVKDFQKSRMPPKNDDGIVGSATRLALATALLKGDKVGAASGLTSATVQGRPDIPTQKIGLGDITRNRPKYIQTMTPGDSVRFSLPLDPTKPPPANQMADLTIKRRGPDGNMVEFKPGDALKSEYKDGQLTYTLTVPKDWPKDKKVEISMEPKYAQGGVVRILIPPQSAT